MREILILIAIFAFLFSACSDDKSSKNSDNDTVSDSDELLSDNDSSEPDQESLPDQDEATTDQDETTADQDETVVVDQDETIADEDETVVDDDSITDPDEEIDSDSITDLDEEEVDDDLLTDLDDDSITTGLESPVVAGQNVTFNFEDNGNTKVVVSGTFNSWSETEAPLVLIDGVWTKTVTLTPGEYAYKFVVDGSWMKDPLCTEEKDDGYGGKNSAFTIAK